MKKLVFAALAAATVMGSSLVASSPAVAAAKYAGTGIAETGGTPLNMRRTPSAAAEQLGSVANGGTVWIMCQTKGDRITGTVRATDIWLRLANNTYVSDAYVRRGSFVVPVCTTAPTSPMPPVSGSWQLPVAAGLVSGFHTAQRPTHDGVDLGATRNTPIRAVSAGSVIRVVCNVSKGSCDVDGNRNLGGCGWYVEVRHAGNIVTRYCHMVRRPSVVVGQTVAKGQILGYVGSSGSSSGPHLHFEVHVNAPPVTSANAVSPITFMRARGLVIK